MKRSPLLLPLLSLLLITACRNKPVQPVQTDEVPWYKTSTIYNVDIDSYKDSDGDGVGDIQGLIQKLDYLKWLGIDVIWLSPFQPTPDKDDGYDVADYYAIDKRLGNQDDFDQFIAEAKKRRIKVIMDLVLNHTSVSHPWFQQAIKDTTSRYFPYYVWSKERPRDWNKGMGFPGVEKETWTYDDQAKHYYFHRFYTFQPDLNIENPDVQAEMKKVLRYWLKQGLDGYRLDAVPFIVDLPKTGAEDPKNKVEFLTEIRKTVKAIKPDALLLGEANVEPEKNIEYFGEKGERLQMMFNFFGNQFLFYAFASGDVKDFVKVLEDTKEKPGTAQWAYFLRNHDEIDLGRLSPKKQELVFSKFAPDSGMILYDRGIRRRLAPMFSNNKQQLELAYSLLFSLPGTPVIRYGEEIGMGDDQQLKERLAVRTPMQWSSSAQAGFSSAGKVFRNVIDTGVYNYKQVNVALQEKSEGSLLNFTRKLIELRKGHPEISLGNWKVLNTGSRHVLAIKYTYRNHEMIAIHNFSPNAVETSINTEVEKGKSLEGILNATNVTPKNSKINIRLDSYDHRWYAIK